MKHYGIYVPKEGTALHMLHPNGTGFVGKKGEEYLIVHYEEPGQADNIKTLEDRLNHAAGRLDQSYPTSKVAYPSESEMELVGYVEHCEEVGWYISLITNPELLESWAPGPHDVGGSTDFIQRALMRNIRGHK
jgi:hypothetical protein